MARVAILALGLTALAGCKDEGGNTYLGYGPKHLRPIASATQTKMRTLNMRASAPILIRLYKQESELEVWKEDGTGKYALLETYPICKWSGKLGPKVKEGDRQAPEGFYTITPGLMNPNSSYHLAFNTGFPNAYDRALGRNGSDLMVHGACSSRGCYAMEDGQIQDIYAIARESFKGGQRSFQLQAFPFRMTPENLAEHAGDPNMDFWMMLKEGSDHFEVTRKVPKVDVCGRRYVFDATPANGGGMDPSRDCPILNVPQEITIMVASKQQKDKEETKRIVAELEAKRKRKEEEKARDLMIASLLGAKSRDQAGGQPGAVPGDGAPTTASEILIASVPLPVASPNRVPSTVQIAAAEPPPASLSFFDSMLSIMDVGRKAPETADAAAAPNAVATATPGAVPAAAASTGAPAAVATAGAAAAGSATAPPAATAVLASAGGAAAVPAESGALAPPPPAEFVTAASIAEPDLAAEAAPAQAAPAQAAQAGVAPAQVATVEAAAVTDPNAPPLPPVAPNAVTPPVPTQATAAKPAEEPSLLAKAFSIFKFN